MVSSGRKDIALNPSEETVLQSLRESLEASKPPPARSLDLIVRILTSWPYSERLAGLDALRCMSKYHSIAQYTSDSHETLIALIISSSLPAGESPNENAVMMGVRALANLFASADGRSAISTEADNILSHLERVTGIRGGEAIGKFNRNVLIAVTTVAVNLGVLVARENLLTAVQRRRLLTILGTILTEQSDAEVLFRALVATGTTVSGDSGPATDGMNVASWIQAAADKASEERVKIVAQECKTVMK